jgi:hypothetical protein
VKLGGEPKKIAILAGLLAVAGYQFYTNSVDSPGGDPPAPPAPSRQPASALVTPPPVANIAGPAPSVTPNIRRDSRAKAAGSFRASMKRRPEDRPDPMKIDPTIRWDLLARLQKVQIEGGDRSLFEFSQPPPAKPDPVIKPAARLITVEPPPKPEPPAPKVEPPKPPPPPIPLKFYGYAANPSGGPRRAFFLLTDEIFMATEGELVQNRYKVVRIGVNWVEVEDTQHKHQQRLVLEEPQAST